MNPTQPTPSNESTGHHLRLVTEQTNPYTPPTIRHLIARQLDRAKEAADRIEREGTVVRDAKGAVMAHPAIAIEIQATKVAADLLGKWTANIRTKDSY